MKYYIVDDEIGTIKTLENIVESRNIGDVIGFETDPVKAEQEILLLRPDVVLVDLLMAKKDGISMVESVRKLMPSVQFIMISQVIDKEMVGQAYEAGIEFFINKPINLIEIERVLTNVNEKIKMNSLVSNIRGIIDMEDTAKNVPRKENDEAVVNSINVLLNAIGMMGEKGTRDIQNICALIIRDGGGYSREVLETVAKMSGEPARNVEQRVRRAIKKGLENVANSAAEDFSSEIFNNYGSYVFDFKNIKDEMNYINGNSESGGRVNISKFVEGIIVYYKSVKK